MHSDGGEELWEDVKQVKGVLSEEKGGSTQEARSTVDVKVQICDIIYIIV